jgi:hypothetical protein
VLPAPLRLRLFLGRRLEQPHRGFPEAPVRLFLGIRRRRAGSGESEPGCVMTALRRPGLEDGWENGQ